MSALSRRLLAQTPFKLAAETAQAHRLQSRCLSSTARTRAKDDGNLNAFLDDLPIPPERQAPAAPISAAPTSPSVPQMIRSKSLAANAKVSPGTPPPAPHSSEKNSLAMLSSLLETNQNARPRTRYNETINSAPEDGLIETYEEKEERPHIFSIYATRHNTHINVATPQGNTLISMSAGNIGFKHSARKHYDSAFQLAAYVMGQLQNKGIVAQIRKMEVTLRGFGAGREAVTKALLGSEGRLLRGKIVKVADATRLKFGGSRSKKPRRLG